MSTRGSGVAGSIWRTARRRWLVLLAPAALAALLTAGLVQLQPPVYGAQAQLMLKFGREYTYRPEADGLQGWQPSRMVELVNAEVRILASRAVRTPVIEEIGVETLYPDLVDARVSPIEARQRAMERLDRDLSVRAIGDSTVIVVAFSHPNPELARRVLASVLDAYRVERARAFGGTDSAVAQAQLERSQAQLAAARAKVDAFREEGRGWLLEIDRSAAEASVRRLEDEVREAGIAVGRQRELAQRLDQELEALRPPKEQSGLKPSSSGQEPAARLQQVLRDASLIAAVAGKDSPVLADLRREEARLYGLVRASYLVADPSGAKADDEDQRVDRLLSAWHAVSRTMPAAEITLNQATQQLGPLRDELSALQRRQVQLDRLTAEESQAATAYQQARRLAERAAVLAILDSRGLDNVVIIDAPEVGPTPLGLPVVARITIGGALGLILGLACACLLDSRGIA
jgi:uncharacterized protein involved in exopolysaccharide biosynthesis